MSIDIKIYIIILFSNILISCSKEEPTLDIDYRNEMREFVIAVNEYTDKQTSNFYIIPQNGIELIIENEEQNKFANNYINAIDGVGQEDLFYGYDEDDTATPISESQYLLDYLNPLQDSFDKLVLVTDYCSSISNIDDSYLKNNRNGFESFAADDRELRTIPNYPEFPINVNAQDVTNLSLVNNFLYLINSENYQSKQEFIEELSQTNYDLLIIDLFADGEKLTVDDVKQLQQKSNGGLRKVICYMSIGEAEDYRYYWEDEWENNLPEFIGAENDEWKGNYVVKYWSDRWKDIIIFNQDSYIQYIIDAGFDGVYLDKIDSYEYFE